jgi:long-chain fatty acid transport protein
MKKLTLTALGLALVCAGNAQAGGYQLNEFSTTGLGRAFAGAGIMDDDYSNLANNPAGMVLAKRSGIQLGYTAVEEYSHIKGTNPGETTKMHYPVSLPSAFGQWRVNDKATLGAGFYVPFGLSTKHKSDSFVGQGALGGPRKSELQVMDTAIAGAYRVTDKLSLGVTGIYRYIHGNMTGNLPGGAGEANYDLDGWTMTGVIGAMYEYSPQTRFGISYKMKSKQTVKGQYSFEANTPALARVFDDGRASPDLPASIILSAYHQLNDKWGLSASARWTQWSVFDTFTMYTPSGTQDPTMIGLGGGGTFQQQHYAWHDTITYSLGADYKINDNWTWRFGGAYDPSPCKSANNRTNRIPDVNRIWAATGFSYQNGNWQLDGGFAHLFMTKGWAHKEYNRTTVEAQYASSSNMYSLNLQYKF